MCRLIFVLLLHDTSQVCYTAQHNCAPRGVIQVYCASRERCVAQCCTGVLCGAWRYAARHVKGVLRGEWCVEVCYAREMHDALGAQLHYHWEYKYTIWGSTSLLQWRVQVASKKCSSKPINIGSSFKALDERSTMMKTVRNLDARFTRYFDLKK